MSEETPKYTIALDLDPWGIIRAGADPVYEHQIYKIRVQSGLVIDMGFTLEDFKQHIAGLAEKLPSKSQIVNPFVSAVRDALARENWYAALALALTLPDICADLEKPKRGVGARYTQWWNTYLSRKYNGALSGDDCYKLRCTFLHQGLGNIRFIFPDPSGRLRPHCNRINGVLQLQVDLFCEHICEGVERWEQKKLPEDPEIQKRANKMLVIFPPEMFAAPNL